MTTTIDAICRYRNLQKRDCWLDVYDAIIELHVRVASLESQNLDERIAGLRDMIRDRLQPRGAGEPEVVPDDDADMTIAAVQSAEATRLRIRNAVLEEVAMMARDRANVCLRSNALIAQSAYLDIAERCRALKTE